MSASYPLFLKLAGKRVLVVGGGRVATDKAMALREAGAQIDVVAPSVLPELVAVAHTVLLRAFEAHDVEGAWLVISAAPSEVNRAARAAADAHRIFVVAVDDAASCTAIGAAKLQRGGLTIALSSDGRSPALVALLRRGIEAVLPDDLSKWVDVARDARAVWSGSGVPLGARKPLLLAALNALYSPNECARSGDANEVSS